MGVRERVHDAIDSSTTRAAKTLAEAPHADPHERLTILVNGWFEGIAAALEEIALELDARDESIPEVDVSPRPAPPAEPEESKAETDEAPDDADEQTLLERARASVEETRALRDERDTD